jgi:hypothetical protein
MLFVIVALMDLFDRQHNVLHPLFVFLFTAWNDYASYTGLSAAISFRRTADEV